MLKVSSTIPCDGFKTLVISNNASHITSSQQHDPFVVTQSCSIVPLLHLSAKHYIYMAASHQLSMRTSYLSYGFYKNRACSLRADLHVTYST